MTERGFIDMCTGLMREHIAFMAYWHEHGYGVLRTEGYQRQTNSMRSWEEPQYETIKPKTMTINGMNRVMQRLKKKGVWVNLIEYDGKRIVWMCGSKEFKEACKWQEPD